MKNILFAVLISIFSATAAIAQTATLSVPSGTTLGTAAGVVSITATISFSGSPSALGWTVNLPSGWTYAGGTGEPGVTPRTGQTGSLDWAYTSMPASPAQFTFRANYPGGLSGAQSIGGSAVYREGGQLRTLSVAALNLTVSGGSGGGDSGGSSTSLRLANISTRVQVGTGANILITGAVLVGQGTKRYLVRAVGPTLGGFGVAGVLADPKVEVYSGNTKIAENDNWDAALSSTFSSAGAFALAAGSRDAALTVTLGAGNYTFQVSGVNGTSGVALVEVYELP